MAVATVNGRGVDLDLAVRTVPGDVLTYHDLRRDDPLLRIALMVCDRYGLDLLLAHVSVIQTKNGRRVYVTRDGYLHLALTRDLLDGMRVVEEYKNPDGTFVCVVWLWRVGREHPFEGRGYCDPGDAQYAKNGRAQARARAERRALRWVVPLEIVGLDDDDDDEPGDVDVDQVGPGTVEATGTYSDAPASTARAVDPIEVEQMTGHDLQRAARALFGDLDAEAQVAFCDRHGIVDRGRPWPDSALSELLDAPFIADPPMH